MAEPRRFVVGVSGASGALYTQRLVRLLVLLGHEVHLTVTDPGKRLLFDELGVRTPGDLPRLAGLPDGAEPSEHGLFLHPIKNVGANIASGSFVHDGMAVIPCSAHTLNAIACGIGDNLLCRAAAVTLKERRKLVLVHRESPLTLIDVRAMERLTLSGAIVAPANPGFYLHPRSIDDLVDFVVGKTLDLLGVQHELDVRWDESREGDRARAEDS